MTTETLKKAKIYLDAFIKLSFFKARLWRVWGLGAAVSRNCLVTDENEIGYTLDFQIFLGPLHLRGWIPYWIKREF